MALSKIKENIIEKAQLTIIERQQNNLQSLENDFGIIYAIDHFLDEKEAKKTLNFLTSISLAKVYFIFFGYRHVGCWCRKSRLQNECLKIILKRVHNKIVLIGNNVCEYKKKYLFPFYEEWRIKNGYDLWFII